MKDNIYKTNCGIESTASDLIGKQCEIVNDEHHKGQQWTIIRKGLFNGCVDIKQPNHVYCDVKISKLKLV